MTDDAKKAGYTGVEAGETLDPADYLQPPYRRADYYDYLPASAPNPGHTAEFVTAGRDTSLDSK